MLWFGKKKERTVETETEEKIEYRKSAGETEALEFSDEDEKISEAEILEALNDEDEPAFENESVFSDNTELDTENEVEEETEVENDDEPNVIKTISDFDELCEFINTKPVGYIQYMRKDENEVFQLREYHLRLARAWTSSSMYRQYTDKEYARVTLAAEVISEPDKFYVLPAFTSSETEAAVMTFCEETLGVNGKKYAKNTAKFAKLVNNGGYSEEWKKYTADLMLLKVERFCKKNDITFSSECDCGEQNDE